jgi:ubiquinone/menaquinone biosynthesis C-methylase UbiE
MHATVFDRLAESYDDVWTHSPIGRAQREAVWRQLGHIFTPGQSVLELGCGTGEDAAHLQRCGVTVVAIDSSPGMVSVARRRGVDAAVRRIEDLQLVEGMFDGAISNFGPLNCVRDLRPVAEQLARLVPSGGFLVFSIIGRFCLWETLYYLSRNDFRRAIRRWRGRATMSSDKVPIFYPSVAAIRRAFAPEFRLVHFAGIGCCIPPSYVQGIGRRQLQRLETIDRRIAGIPLLRALSDHRLLILRRS